MKYTQTWPQTVSEVRRRHARIALQAATVQIGHVQGAGSARPADRDRRTATPRAAVNAAVDRIRVKRGRSAVGAAIPGTHVLADVAAVDAVLKCSRVRQRLQWDGERYERQRRASSTPSATIASVGQASMQARHSPQASQAGCSGEACAGAISASVISAPSTTHDPWRRVMASVFLPNTATPARAAASRSTWPLLSTCTTKRLPGAASRSHDPSAGAGREQGVLVAPGVAGHPAPGRVVGLVGLRPRVALRDGDH